MLFEVLPRLVSVFSFWKQKERPPSTYFSSLHLPISCLQPPHFNIDLPFSSRGNSHTCKLSIRSSPLNNNKIIFSYAPCCCTHSLQLPPRRPQPCVTQIYSPPAASARTPPQTSPPKMVRPIANNHQEQSMVTTLRGILRLYPGGHTIFRELLQNADDAGAKTVVSLLLHFPSLQNLSRSGKSSLTIEIPKAFLPR